MESSQKEPAQASRQDHDIDLGFVLYRTGQAFKQLIFFLVRCLRDFLRVIIYFLLLLKRNIIWLGLGAVAGLGYGIYRNAGGSKYQYSSSSIVKMNFGSTPSLYNSIEYLNSLIDQGNQNELAKIFGITNEEASTITDFNASPVKNDIVAADLYTEQFFRRRSSEYTRTDTFWGKVIPFNDFKSELTKFDYPMHTIIAISSNAHLFPKLQQGIVNLISEKESLQQNKVLYRKSLDDQEQLLEHSLQSLDTLNDAYIKKLLQHNAEKENSVNNIISPDRLAVRVPELELYDKIIFMKDELAALRTKSMMNREIVQVYAPFNATGERKNVLVVDLAKTTAYGLAIAIIVVLLVVVFISLGKIRPDSL